MKKSKFQFENPRVKEILFKTNDSLVDEDREETNFQIKTESSVIKTDEGKQAQVVLKVSLPESEKEMRDKKLPYFCEVSIIANFYWEEDLEKRILDSFLKVNAPALLLAYARTTIAQITMQAGFTAFHLPFIDFRNSEAEEKK